MPKSGNQDAIDDVSPENLQVSYFSAFQLGAYYVRDWLVGGSSFSTLLGLITSKFFCCMCCFQAETNNQRYNQGYYLFKNQTWQ